MSYDLEVYGKVSLTARELAKVVSSVRGLKATVDRRSQTISSIMHKRGRAIAFELDGPDQLEPEDIPEGWTEVADATVLYSIHVPYDVQSGAGGFSFSVDGPNLAAATAFAARLAERVDGTVIDPQDDEPPAPEPEPDPAPEPEPERPRFLHLRWFRLLDDVNDKDLAEIYLRTAREFFPPGVPSRFGTYEPFQGRFPRDDDAKFDAMYRDDCFIGDLILAGKPIEHGTIDGWTNDLRQRTQSVRLKFEFDRLVKLKALDAIEPFFVALAERTGSFFAFAEVNTSRYATAQRFMAVKRDDPWSGLPTEPQWLTWFGPEYAELVAPHLDPTRMAATSLGTLHRWTKHPAEVDELRALSGDPWIPAAFRGVIDPTTDERCGKAAEVMPESLRYPAPGSPQALRIEAHYARMREIEANARKRAAEGHR
ncbi:MULTISPECIES: hypothetical protein [unclassified Microbacterium]|uniref:hypothetical protein n=1 Tax=unclassified Microbacterium TaxID=2609290 RepID=UPI00160509BA|nr:MULTISPECIES: hypothetical protein [unclassified Microbacterium]QNA91299.1 hypothetical protein G4G29_00490 [Microbacterium sp. Se63.02b]QYM64450.1 hypothetical protein K1X59_00505 [Microbacterium sp. Se5.02b]